MLYSPQKSVSIFLSRNVVLATHYCWALIPQPHSGRQEAPQYSGRRGRVFNLHFVLETAEALAV